MALLNYQPRKRESHTELRHEFKWPTQYEGVDPGGFSFDLNHETNRPIFRFDIGGDTNLVWEYGTEIPLGINVDDHPGVINYKNCINGVYDIIDEGISEQTYWGEVQAHGECAHCGTTVWLYNDYGHGIDCSGCEAIYSSTGQELAPRSQWDDRYSEESTQPYWAEFGYSDY